jgi:hypothetical protein
MNTVKERIKKMMSKKVILSLLLVGLIGVLVTGAIIRTADRSGNVAEARGLGRGQANGEGTGGYGLDSYNDGGRGRGGYGGEGRTDAPGDGTGTGQAQVDVWVTLHGTVMTADADVLLVQTDGGEEVTVENRPWWFAQEQGFSAEAGDAVTMVGFYENDDFEAGQISNAATGQTVSLRDENGRPLWAGRGWRGG